MDFSDFHALVVDDFTVMRRIIKNMLRKLGVLIIDEAEDGKAAYDMIKQRPYNLIILDWNMPRMSGLDLLTVLRKDTKHKTIPVLMVTSEALESQVITAVQAGATNYIVKPFTEETLIKKLMAIMKAHPEIETI